MFWLSYEAAQNIVLTAIVALHLMLQQLTNAYYKEGPIKSINKFLKILLQKQSATNAQPNTVIKSKQGKNKTLATWMICS